GEVIAGFTFAMMWGVVVGTYSSIFIAVPLLIFMGVKRDWSL
ncbi:MAG: protein translocase subunit SecF, partial [Alphaproteobacteria bacterium]|nr:protein translocase subunit SecF [Alphaproteobacteria bacterium]